MRRAARARRGSITGRDETIVAQALHRFIRTEEIKPDCDVQHSNLEDARALLNALMPGADEKVLRVQFVD